MMMSLKGTLKYLIYIFIAGWMFLLGIVVGRGTSPVTFDTQKFQERLEFIAKERDKKEPEKNKEVDLGFFGALKHPIPTEGNPAALKSKEILPEKEVTRPVTNDSIPMKKSLKTMTDRRHLLKDAKVQLKKKVTSVSDTADIKKKKVTQNKSKSSTTQLTDNKDKVKTAQTKGVYTIQVASYKNSKDADQRIALLQKKGFTAYKEKTQIKGDTWYRVRLGSFFSLSKAKEFKERLNNKKIKGLIIKKEQS